MSNHLDIEQVQEAEAYLTGKYFLFSWKKMALGLVGLGVLNVIVLAKLQSRIEDKAISAAKRAAINHIENSDSDIQNRIERLNTSVDDKADQISTRVGGLLIELDNHERALQKSSIRVRQTNEELRKLKLVGELSDDQRILLAELIGQTKSEETQKVAKLLGSRVDAVHLPVGTILPWHKHVDTKTGEPVNPPPSGWVECNGSIKKGDDNYIEDSIIDLAKIPDLNNEGWFLRGGIDSGTFQDDAFQGHGHDVWFHSSYNKQGDAGDSGHTKALGPELKPNTKSTKSLVRTPLNLDHGEPRIDHETRPKNMSVVWIIRVK
ncbi:MAG TPA: hypothetical protein PKN33_16890 [Phycisphaerae bacterium]|nr:hypothetical protein [Phycisphaerae bacterium]